MHIDHVAIVVSDLESARDFFLMLGFTQNKREHMKGGWIDAVVKLDGTDAEYISFEFPNSQTKLEIVQFKSPKSGKDPWVGKANQIGIRHIAFQTDDIEAMVETLKKKNVEFFSDIVTGHGGHKKVVYFYGPDNIILELAQYS